MTDSNEKKRGGLDDGLEKFRNSYEDWLMNKKYVLNELNDIDKKLTSLSNEIGALTSCVHMLRTKVSAATWIIGLLASILLTEVAYIFRT